MAKVRSPNYPAMDLGAALESARPAWKAENRNKMSRAVLARHMGYTSLNGRALTKIGAVRAFSIIDGSGDSLRLSDDAITALASRDKAGVQYKDALLRLALSPTLFQEIKKQFPDTLPSEHNVSFWLVQQGFTENAAGKAAKSFLATMRLVFEDSAGYSPENEQESSMPAQEAAGAKSILDVPSSSIPRVLMTQEKFDLEEGTVTISVPSVLSRDSYQDFADRMQILLRGLKRRSDAEEASKE